MNPNTWMIQEGEDNERVDKRLAREMRASRTTIQDWISAGYVLVNEQPVKSNYKLQSGDVIEVAPPSVPEEPEVLPEHISLDIRFEDEALMFVNKGRGMVVHPAPGHHSGTLVNALLYHTSSLSDINGTLRPGIVHRLDKDTSGLMVAAKTNQAHRHLAHQLQVRSLTREYTALVKGNIPHEQGIIEAPIGRDPNHRQKMAVTDVNAKEAITHFTVLERFSGYTMVQCRLETGRTHQIRVHMAYIGHPLVSDPKYGNEKSQPLAGQALHAQTLSLFHPETDEKITVTAPLPKDMENVIEQMRHSH